MKIVTLGYDSSLGPEDGARRAQKGGSVFGCEVSLDIKDNYLVVKFPEGTKDETVFHVMTQMRGCDDLVESCSVSGCDAYTEQKIHEFWHV